MRPFTKERSQSNNKDIESKSESKPDANYEVSLLAIAKKVGLSFDELNILTMNDFMDFVDIHLEKTSDRVVERDATLEDIEKFYSNK